MTRANRKGLQGFPSVVISEEGTRLWGFEVRIKGDSELSLIWNDSVITTSTDVLVVTVLFQ